MNNLAQPNQFSKAERPGVNRIDSGMLNKKEEIRAGWPITKYYINLKNS